MYELLLSLKKKSTDPSIPVGTIGTPVPDPVFDVKRINSAICAVDKSIYVSGGLLANNTVTRTFAKYDTVAKVWTALPDIPAAIINTRNHAMTAIGTDIYLFTNTPKNSGAAGIFNTLTNTWTTKPAANPFGNNWSAGISNDGRYIYQTAGTGGAGVQVVTRLDTTTWTYSLMPPTPYGSSYTTTAIRAGILYFVAMKPNGDWTIFSLDTMSGTDWVDTGIIIPPTNDAQLLHINGWLISALGFDANQGRKDIYNIDTDTQTVTVNGTIPNGRVFGKAVVLDNLIWLYGGYNNGTSGSVQGNLTPYNPGIPAQ
jgi:hypothetical protein